MKIHELQVEKRASKKRIGRGISAGQGKTAGRGTKGQNSRTGKKLRAGFEGGQNSLMTRIPKLKGFKSKKVPMQVVYTGNLALLTGKIASNETFAEQGLVASAYNGVKIITQGKVEKAFTVKVQAVSASAKVAIEKAGGSVELVATPGRPVTSTKKES